MEGNPRRNEREEAENATTKDTEERLEDRVHLRGPNNEVERHGVAVPTNEADLSQSSIPSLAYRRCNPVIARTDC